jgi:ring-1,2-phenylacetyl-CoA epoxidase subunit PaaD
LQTFDVKLITFIQNEKFYVNHLKLTNQKNFKLAKQFALQLFLLNMVTIHENLKSFLEKIPDPEIPVLTILDLGVIRKATENENGEVEITITPTYSGCPAMKQMEYEIRNVLEINGYKKITINTVYSPAWTTDWMPDEALEKLRKYGISPPEKTTQDKLSILGKSKIVKCPQCGSANSEMVSQFGSTACKALYKCKDCLEPFDYFKCI